MEQTPKNEKLFTRNFVLTSLSTFAIFTSFYFLLVTLPIYILELGGSESEIGLIIGVFTISAVLLRPFIGMGVDIVGRRKILVAGSVIFLVSMLLYNYTTSVFSLLLLRVFHGIGWGAATTAASTLIADIAPASRRGEAMGVFGISSNVAMAIGPALSFSLLYISGVPDFPRLFLAGAAIALVSLLLVIPISETVVVRPKTSLFSKEAYFPSALMFSVALTYGSIVSFLSLFVQKEGAGNPGIFFTVFAVTLILVRALAGKLSDIKGRKFVIVPGMIIISIGLWVLSMAGSLWVFLAAALLYGLGFGLVHPTLMAFLVDRVNERGRGAAMGTFTAAFDLGIGAGSIILGVVLQFFGFRVMYVLSGLVVLAGAIWFIMLNDKQEV
ncbi:MFS transporter [Candidatus Methanoperedens nitratireducens]|uniref:Major facilitator family transporter n=1 Tax=Candidatus Methanoperedens nitratireducens TaxID=1392998 RepID=A0A284VUG1_9EURY|nr:MFS transporter [Candidatus Methanoperedens nitroreducens]SNQ62818.1 Major facilitator family transporter [Candidatus Methanoperedens nitroreducens]